MTRSGGENFDLIGLRSTSSMGARGEMTMNGCIRDDMVLILAMLILSPFAVHNKELQPYMDFRLPDKVNVAS